MLSVRNVCAGYDGKQVLFDVSFEIEKGEQLSIIGPNGCGKTTLLRAIANIIPFSGQILLDGSPINILKRKNIAKKIAFLSQIMHIYFNYTVFETVMMGRYPHMKKSLFPGESAVDKEAVEAALLAVHMQDFKNRDISTLSGGQLQRVFLAKILAQEPDFILLDEPTNHLDLSYQVELIQFLKQWSIQNNKSVIGVLHDINLAMNLSDKFLILDKGAVKAYGDRNQSLTTSVLSDVYKMDINEYMKQSLKQWEAM